jgi:hypothetical protein
MSSVHRIRIVVAAMLIVMVGVFVAVRVFPELMAPDATAATSSLEAHNAPPGPEGAMLRHPQERERHVRPPPTI